MTEQISESSVDMGAKAMTAYKIVPVAPTEEMRSAMETCFWESDESHSEKEAYKAALAAAPSAAENEELVESVAAGIAHRVHFDRGIGVRLTHEDSVDLARAAIRAIEGKP